METNAYAAGEALDPEMMEETESTTLTDLLTSKAPEQRVQYFRRIFHKTEQPIQDIDTPLLCQTYPDFTNDICEAYLQYRTFTARVWANYDGACKQFFTDGRAVNCGKLVSKISCEMLCAVTSLATTRKDEHAVASVSLICVCETSQKDLD